MAHLRPSRNRPSRLCRLSLAIAAVLLTLAMTEVAIRIHERWMLGQGSTRFSSESQAAPTLNMAILGGSTAYGYPYFERFNMLTFSAMAIAEQARDRDVDVADYSAAGCSLEQTAELYYRDARVRPDVMVVCAGDNEFCYYYAPNLRSSHIPRIPLLEHSVVWRTYLRFLLLHNMNPDKAYRGPFISREVIPTWERDYNLKRFLAYMRGLIRHCDQNGIHLLVVIPDRNLSYEPNRSAFSGPKVAQDVAQSRFKQAYAAYTRQSQPRRAEELLMSLVATNGFAHAYHALGLLKLQAGATADAERWLRLALETDAYPGTTTDPYADALRTLLSRHKVPFIELRSVLEARLQGAIPGYDVFFDNCHFTADVYLDLTEALLDALNTHYGKVLGLPALQTTLNRNQLCARVGLDTAYQQHILRREALWFEDQATVGFLHENRLARSREYLLLAMAADPGSDASTALAPDLQRINGKLEEARKRIDIWLRSPD